MSKVLNLIKPNSSKFLAISKSGKTTETIAILLVVIEWLLKNDIKVDESVMAMCENINNTENALMKIVHHFYLNNISKQVSILHKYLHTLLLNMEESNHK